MCLGRESAMERRYELRLEQMLAQAEVSPELMQGLLKRLDAFAEPFAKSLTEPGQQRHAAEYMAGLLSKLERKTGEAIAYLHDQERQGLQKFVGHVPWDHKPLLETLALQVGEDLGESDAVIVFDPSAFHKKWTKDRARCKAAGVPKEVKFRTRHQLALEMLDECGKRLPHSWVAGDDEMGRSSSFRRELQGRGERFLLAVPSNTLVRDLDVPPPEYVGRGRHPMSPFLRLDRWCAALPEDAWTRIDVRDGEKGPLVIEVVKRRVQARTETGGTGPEELLLVTRERQADGTFKHDYYLSNAAPELPLKELARVSKAAHRIEECIKNAKGGGGLGRLPSEELDR